MAETHKQQMASDLYRKIPFFFGTYQSQQSMVQLHKALQLPVVQGETLAYPQVLS